MSFVSPLAIGNIDASGNIRPLDMAAIRRIAAEFADCEANQVRDASRPDVHAGYFDGVPLYADRRGLLVTHVGYQDTSRLFACLSRLVRELGYNVWGDDSGECWNEIVCRPPADGFRNPRRSS
jgi:hypothetical protein